MPGTQSARITELYKMAIRNNSNTSIRLILFVLMMLAITNLLFFLTYYHEPKRNFDKYRNLLKKKIAENSNGRNEHENVLAVGICNCTFPGTKIVVKNASTTKSSSEFSKSKNMSSKSNVTKPTSTPTKSSSEFSKSKNMSSKSNVTKPASVVIPLSTIVVTTTNTGFLDITENMLESVKRTGTRPNITVIAEDEPSYKALSERAKTQPGLSIQKTNSGVTTTDKLMVNSKVYNQFVNKRPAYVLSFLEKGNRVLFVDADTYWFHDPLKSVDWDFDIALHNELGKPRRWFCDGFVYYNPTNKTIKLVKEWAHLLATTEKKTPDQEVLNGLMSNKKIPGLKVKTLKASQFPDGKKYFQTKGWKEKNNDTIVVHLSYVLGHDTKVKVLKEQGLWLI